MKTHPPKLRLDPEPTKKPARKVHRDAVPEAVLNAAQTERENAFDAEHTWHVWNEQKHDFQPVMLHGYSSGREALFYKLRAADGALPLSKTLEQLTTFLADAIKIYIEISFSANKLFFWKSTFESKIVKNFQNKKFDE